MAEALITGTAGYVDPRVRRTRQMLEKALAALLATTLFEDISVTDITAAATLNRATFYAHYEDKVQLLTAMVASRFEDLPRARNVAFDGRCSSPLYAITLALCDYLAAIPYCPAQRHMEQHLEGALSTIVQGMITDGLKKHSAKGSLSAGIDRRGSCGGDLWVGEGMGADSGPGTGGEGCWCDYGVAGSVDGARADTRQTILNVCLPKPLPAL